MVITDGITGAWANDAASETRYKPCPLRFPAGVLREGEVRYVTPGSTLPTRYTFTGQSSHVADEATDLWTSGFGLIFYNACWLRSVPGMECRGYDPALGRFAQADTVIPGAGDPQAWDRYAYNSPLNRIFMIR